MFLGVLVTLFDPLFCVMVHLYVNLLPSSTNFSPCLLQVICGRGVPSAPQFIIPDV